MIKENTWTGKRVKLVDGHSHEGEYGVVKGIEKTTAGYGFRIKLESGQECFVYKGYQMRESE